MKACTACSLAKNARSRFDSRSAVATAVAEARLLVPPLVLLLRGGLAPAPPTARSGCSLDQLTSSSRAARPLSRQSARTLRPRRGGTPVAGHQRLCCVSAAAALAQRPRQRLPGGRRSPPRLRPRRRVLRV